MARIGTAPIKPTVIEGFVGQLRTNGSWEVGEYTFAAKDRDVHSVFVKAIEEGFNVSGMPRAPLGSTMLVCGVRFVLQDENSRQVRCPDTGKVRLLERLEEDWRSEQDGRALIWNIGKGWSFPKSLSDVPKWEMTALAAVSKSNGPAAVASQLGQSQSVQYCDETAEYEQSGLESIAERTTAKEKAPGETDEEFRGRVRRTLSIERCAACNEPFGSFRKPHSGKVRGEPAQICGDCIGTHCRYPVQERASKRFTADTPPGPSTTAATKWHNQHTSVDSTPGWEE